MNVLNQTIIKHKMGLLNLADELRNVSQACRVMGVSRDTFYRVKETKALICCIVRSSVINWVTVPPIARVRNDVAG